MCDLIYIGIYVYSVVSLVHICIDICTYMRVCMVYKTYKTSRDRQGTVMLLFCDISNSDVATDVCYRLNDRERKLYVQVDQSATVCQSSVW